MIGEQDLLNELQSLQAQKATLREQLSQIEGAERMVRHLLTKRAAVPLRDRNGLPAEGTPVEG